MEFFDTLQDHSGVKLSILEQYTIPWMRKIILNPYGSKKCLVIDGFSGTGRYEENGSPGSPLILIKNAMDFYDQALDKGWDAPKIFIYLNEYDSDNFSKLKQNVSSLGFDTPDGEHFVCEEYSSILIKLINATFEDFMTDLLADIENGSSLIPSFCFVDPFGFSTTPFTLFKTFLRNRNSELMLNFIYEETNRFIRHPNPKIQRQISDNLGLINLEALIKSIDGKSPLERKQVIVETYTKNILEETNAFYVRNFELKKNGRTKMILFHMTQNINGLSLIKEVMWKHDGTGTYLYDDRKQLAQLDFEEILKHDKQNHIKILSEQIAERFTGEKNVTMETIKNFTIIKSIYPLPNFLKPALKLLEAESIIENFRGRGKKNSYPESCSMDFK
ncbi:three-Cys-motif partner protein TcmP [Domibacillus enclensis]|uniref:Three-Cys-motif partner protein n=1 Tax=Domibacillus enclensis TaxID=1017273 RepID=A0A1N6WE90_9BACI|nr:three-Cys-motif partner protein TcmP [Domibacillus enclensis]OXS77913.1 hypothetical protein B1B05_09915 [Domibacillus enclensis]SIQ88290.1 three-Cys-motif partner protein [Domibacillus enclensis]